MNEPASAGFFMSARKGVNPRRKAVFSLERQRSMKVLLLLFIPLLLMIAALFTCKAARKFVYDCGHAGSQLLHRLMARNGLILSVWYVPEGSKFFFSETFATAKGITALTNASPALATSAAHGYVDNNEILLTSGWEDASASVWRVDTIDANSFTVLGLDSTDVNYYAPGGGTGTAQLVGPWTEIPQVLDITSNGGDPRFTQINPLSRRNAINMPTGFNPASIELRIGHDPNLAALATMRSISRRLSKCAFKMTLSNGAAAYAYGTLAISEIPTMASGQPITVRAALSVDGRMISY